MAELSEARLIEKLRALEALYAPPGTTAEGQAAVDAAERILQRLTENGGDDEPVEYRFSMPDMWSRRVFVALLRCHGLRPYRYRRQRYTTVMAKVSKRFVDETLWPQYEAFSNSLREYLAEVTDRVVSQVIHDDLTEAAVVEDPPQARASAGDEGKWLVQGAIACTARAPYDDGDFPRVTAARVITVEESRPQPAEAEAQEEAQVDRTPTPLLPQSWGSSSFAATMIVRSAFAGSTMQLQVELQHITPAVWRRLVVSAEVTLDVVHDILQVAFGWRDSHLHDFRVGDARFGMADVAEELLLVDERAAPIGAVACAGTTLVYLYDYWRQLGHTITVDGLSPPDFAALLERLAQKLK